MPSFTVIILAVAVAGSTGWSAIAAPMVGGLATSFVMELLVYPPIYFLYRKRQLPVAAVTNVTTV